MIGAVRTAHIALLACLQTRRSEHLHKSLPPDRISQRSAIGAQRHTVTEDANEPCAREALRKFRCLRGARTIERYNSADSIIRIQHYCVLLPHEQLLFEFVSNLRFTRCRQPSDEHRCACLAESLRALGRADLARRQLGARFEAARLFL